MPPTRHLMLVPLCLSVAAMVGCDRASYAGGGHSPAGHNPGTGHGHGEAEGPDPISVTLFTPKVQLFMEYPHLVKGEDVEFLAHLTVLATGEPIRSGTLTFDLTLPDGLRVSETLQEPKRDGLFVPQRRFDAEGRYGLQLILDSPQAQETIDVGELIVHPDVHEAQHAAEAAASAEPPNLVPFLLEQQWKIGTLYVPIARRTLVHRLAIPGRIAAPQGASASVSPPIAGRLLPPPGGRLPRIGDPVEAGQVLAMIEPQLSSTEIVQLSANRAQVQAFETELALRELDLDTKALEVDRSIIQSEARLDFARLAMRRATRLSEKGVGTEQQHEEAQQDLRLAEAEHQAAQAMKRSYENARARLASLRAEALPDKRHARPANATHQMPLAAPIPGEIVHVAHIEGEHLNDAHEEVFRVVNKMRVWIEADISEFDLAELDQNPGATISLPAYPGRSFDMLDSGGGRLVNIGSIVDVDTRTLSVVYEMPNPDGFFRIGMLADVFLETRTATDVVAIPEEAVVRDNGRPTAYVLIDGENFQRRELGLGVRDNGWVEVLTGIREGDRVVTKGAYAIKLASLSPASSKSR